MKLIIFITISLFAYNLKANDIKIIELHSSQSLNQLILGDSKLIINNDNVNTPEEDLQVALDFMLKQKYIEAKVSLESFIQSYPENTLSSSAHFWLGKIYLFEKNYRKSAIVFGEGIQKFPTSVKAAEMYYELAKSLFMMGKPEEGCRTLVLLSERYPKSKIIKKRDESYNLNCNTLTKITKLNKEQYEVITDALNGREKPSTNSKKIKKYYIGDILTVTGSNSDWYEVQDPKTNKPIYVAKKYLRSFKINDQDISIDIASKDLANLKNNLAEKKLSSADNNKKSNKKLPKPITKKTSKATITEDEDKEGPVITTPLTIKANDMEVVISGTVTDNSAIMRLLIDNDPVSINNNQFTKNLYIPDENYTVQIKAIDKHGNSSLVEVSVTQEISEKIIQLAKLNPLSIKGPVKNNAIAIIIGVEKYKGAVPDALYAVNDAKMFKGFANKVFGVPIDNIKVLTNEEANLIDTQVLFEGWLSRRIKENESDVYLFYSGHGLGNVKEKDLYLLPYDGKPDYLNKTSLKRKEIFNDIDELNPKSVTVFLDTCYSGQTRDEEVLLASAKPIVIEVEEQDIPENFTVFSASANNQIASSFTEAGHGLFSYYMMQGLEGKADMNNDQQITANELFAYLSSNVSKQAESIGRTQQPQLHGGSDRILVQW